MRKFLWLLIVVVAAYGAGRAYYRLTDDFRMGNITQSLAPKEDWDVPPLSSKNQALLDQKFTYLGKGAQSFAFLSEDGKYVLKLFKYKHFKPSFLTQFLPEEYRERDRKRKEWKLNSTLDGYKLAYDVHKDESGLIAIHFNPTDNIVNKVLLIDKIGREWNLDLNHIVFIIQEKVIKSRDEIKQHLDEGNIELAKRRIGQIFELYASEYSKGIYDRDHGVMHNTGFAHDKPIHLDVGKLSKDERMKDPEFYRDDIDKVVKKIDLYVKTHYPQYHTEIVKDMEDKLSEIFKSNN